MNDFRIKLGLDKSSFSGLKKPVMPLSQILTDPKNQLAQSKQVKQTGSLNKNMEKLVKSLEKLVAALGKGGGEGGGGGKSGFSGLGKVGAAAGLVGIPLALGAFVGHLVSKIGKQYIEKATEQLGTAGVAGFQTGRFGYFTARDMGQLYKSHKMASGSNSDPASSYNGTDGYVTYGAGSYQKYRQYTEYYNREGKQRETGIAAGIQDAKRDGDTERADSLHKWLSRLQAESTKMLRTSYVARDSAAVAYAKKFGIGAGEFGETMGLMDRTTGGKSRETFSSVLGAGHAGGIQTEMPKMIEAVSQALRDSVKEGIVASHLAKDIAKETSILTKYSPTQSVEQAVAAINRLQSAQKGVAGGQFGSSYEQFSLFNIAKNRVKDIVGGGGSQAEKKWLEQMAKEQNISPEQLASGKLDPHTLTSLSQDYSLAGFSKQRESYISDIMDRFGGKGGSFAQRKNQAWRVYQSQLGGSLSRKEFSVYANRSAGFMGGLGDIDTSAQTITSHYRKDTSNAATRAQSLHIGHEQLALSGAAAKAAESVYAFEDALMQTANRLQGTAIKGLDMVETVVKKTSNLLDKVMKTAEQWGFIEKATGKK